MESPAGGEDQLDFATKRPVESISTAARYQAAPGGNPPGGARGRDMISRFEIPADWKTLSERERIALVCVAFERSWRAGANPRIEECLSPQWEVDPRQLLLQLTSLESRLRRERGESTTLAEYVGRFPDYREVLEQNWQLIHDSDDQTVASTIAVEFDSRASSPGRRLAMLCPDLKAGRYELQTLLGRGGFGEAWLAFDPVLKRKVAVKRVRPDRQTAPSIAARFLEEGRKLALLEHVGILRVYDVGFQDGVCFIVSQLIEGETLHQRMNREPYGPSDAAGLVAAVADAVHVAHLQNVIHRDIKPANILLDQKGRPVLADFGLAATEVELLDEPAGTVGTYAYMSPEQIAGHSNRVDPRADIYSLGAVLYHLLTGRPPFVATDPQQYRELVLNGTVRPPRTINDAIPPSLEAICLRCLNRDVAARYSTGHDLAVDLRQAVSPPVRPPAPRSPWARIAVAAACAGAGVLLAWGVSAVPSRQSADVATRGGETVVAVRPLPPPIDELERDESGYLIRPAVWQMSGDPLDLRVQSDGAALHVVCPGSGVVLLLQPDSESCLFEFDLTQRRWPGGVGIVTAARPSVIEGSPAHTFDGFLLHRGDDGWLILRRLHEQLDGTPDDSWNSHTLETLSLEPWSTPTLHIRLEFADATLQSLEIGGQSIQLELPTESPGRVPTDLSGGGIGLMLANSELTLSNVTINRHAVRFAD